MAFSFEVKESDLLGRVGVIRVGGKTLETPCLLPVIHPVSQAVSAGELKEIGFKGLMTNSYIIHSRRREEALLSGLHDMLGFDGVFMTDSGGYQVLEYGKLELDYAEVAAFQTEIGSELAVTLDRPTGYPQPRSYARETMEYSLKNAVATINEYGDGKTEWVGPVQGGLFLELVKRSARSLVKAGFSFLALGSPVQVMENYMFADLVKMIAAARSAMPYSVPLHLFGAGHPLTMALAVALGCDTFDSASYILFARNGRYMSRTGVLTLASMKFLPCSCRICAKTTVRELLDLEVKERVKALAVHNLCLLREEVETCKEAIVEGRLWDLVEERSMAHPRLRDAFAELSKHHELLSGGTPQLKNRGLFLRSAADLGRPELRSSGRRLARAMRRRSEKAVLVLPNSSTPSGRRQGGEGISLASFDAYRLHPVLGLYPAELDFVYPFTQTVASGETGSAVTPKDAVAKLRQMGYRTVRVVSARSGRIAVRRARNKRTRRAASLSPPASSALPRSPRRP